MNENDNDNVIPGPGHAGDSEPINDDPGIEQDAPQEEGEPIAYAVHLILMQNGQFAIQATGEPNIGEMQMLISRGHESVRSRQIAETVAQVLREQQKPQSRIITPKK